MESNVSRLAALAVMVLAVGRAADGATAARRACRRRPTP